VEKPYQYQNQLKINPKLQNATLELIQFKTAGENLSLKKSL
jgi:hypothetical protein